MSATPTHDNPDQRRLRPDVSVIVPTRDRPAMLAEALASIAAQDWDSWECVVVDDGSRTQPTTPAQDDRFHIVRRQTPGGPAAARNQGVRASRGRYVTFLDDDDLMAPARFRIALAALSSHPGANCHVGTLIRSTAPQVPARPLKGRRLTEGELRTGTPSLEMLLLERELVAPFDEELRVSEDVEWWLRVEPSIRPVITSDVVSIVRLHNGARDAVSSEVRFESRRRTYLKHRGSMGLVGAVRSRQLRRLAESALACGKPWMSARYALLSFLTSPNLRKLKLTVRSLWAGISVTLRGVQED